MKFLIITLLVVISSTNIYAKDDEKYICETYKYTSIDSEPKRYSSMDCTITISYSSLSDEINKVAIKFKNGEYTLLRIGKSEYKQVNQIEYVDYIITSGYTNVPGYSQPDVLSHNERSIGFQIIEGQFSYGSYAFNPIKKLE